MHPLFIFIFSLLASITSLFIFIRSYLKVHRAFIQVVEKYHLNAGQFLETETWVIVLILSLLVSIILAGLLIIYIYHQKMMKLYRMQQNFINGFTHELKTPLASLQIFIETFMRYELSRIDQLKYLNLMSLDCKRLNDNVGRILKIGKLEEDYDRSMMTQIELVAFIQSIIDKSKHLFQAQNLNLNLDENVQVELRSSLNSCEAMIDRELFEMLVMNLMINGLIHNKSKLKKFTIELSQNKNEIVLDFIDNGVGIDKNEWQNVFKKFYQVGKANKGNGLGLYFVGQIAKIHNGGVRILHSQKELGTTIRYQFKKVQV